MNILLKAAKIVDSSQRELHLKKRDIHIRDGVLVKLAPKIEPEGNMQVLEYRNLHISRGWFDSSVSFGEPGYEERETISNGLLTAAKSGFTDIVLNPNCFPLPDSSSDIVFLRNAGRGLSARLHPLGSLTVKSEGRDLAEIYDMHKAGAVGFYDFKKPVTNSNLLKIALLYARNFNGLVCSFPLDVQMASKGIVNEGEVSVRLGLKGIPSLAEELQLARDLYILEYTGGKLHIPTISTARAVKLVDEAKKKGLDVSCSVALHNLYATDAELEEFDSNFKTMPPLRSKSDARVLLKGLKAGKIDYVTTDHCPMDIEEKRVEFDNAGYGTLGLESAFGILMNLVDLETAIDLLTRGRKRFGIPEPEIREGALANICLFDPDQEYTFGEEHLYSTSKNSLFFGKRLIGRAYGSIAHRQSSL